MAAMDDLKDIMLRRPRLTLAVAESLTGGHLQARITSISGASEFFLGGLTAYELDQKVRHLGVSRAKAKAVNSVSAGVAKQMAQGACELFKADVGVATTGYAQAAAKWNVTKPFAWWGLARRLPDGSYALKSGRVDLSGLTRKKAQERAAQAALDALVGWVREPAAACKP
jgi:nicotinamide-nucleotide amidase